MVIYRESQNYLVYLVSFFPLSFPKFLIHFLKKVFWFICIINLCRQFFVFSERKVLDQNEPYIKTFQIVLRNFWNSVSRLSSVFVGACVFIPAYTSSCRGLKYSPIVRYIILVDSNRAGFLIF